MEVLKVLILVLLSVQYSECVQCFASFDRKTGQCAQEVGEVEEDDCCQNPLYGYLATDGVCRSCGPPLWSPWSSWSHCNVLCGEGVRQKSRKCFGIGASECENPKDSVQMEPCSGVCCDVKGWDMWLPWSPCSVTCGEGGVRKRERKCSNPPQCYSACSGASTEEEICPTHTCPVHGGWSSWSDWSTCSGSCIDDQQRDIIAPFRQRFRSCSNPAPSKGVPPGNFCPGEAKLVLSCSELPNCPVAGGWGAWSSPGPCSASCGEGLQLSTRMCDNPAPRSGGRYCDGSNAQRHVCSVSDCPVDGVWSGWSHWGACSSSCIPQGRVPTMTRQRLCSNPVPSSTPPGKPCPGDHRQVENCHLLPHCRVDGVWGSWSPFSSCPVTCGVSHQVSIRSCDGPAPQHGGSSCPGYSRRKKICRTHVDCPVNGLWSEWSPWEPCTDPYDASWEIRCKDIGGSQSRERTCLYQAHDGASCSGEVLIESRGCYNVSGCYFKGTLGGWGSWSLCYPPCGSKSRRFREKTCSPDYSNYSPTIGRDKEPANYFGVPNADCGDLPDGEDDFQDQNCLNAPPCV